MFAARIQRMQYRKCLKPNDAQSNSMLKINALQSAPMYRHANENKHTQTRSYTHSTTNDGNEKGNV